MLDKIKEICDDLPDLVKAIIMISIIAIFWDIVI
jgi:hypothetical protein